MNPALRSILRRWKWVYLLGGFMVIAMAFAYVLGDPGPFVPTLAPAVLLAVLPSQFDRQAGRLRNLLALPMEDVQIVGAYWTASVIIPAAMMIVGLTGTLGVMSAFGRVRPESWACLAVVAPLSPLICGACWFLMVRMSQSVNEGTGSQHLWGAAYGLTVGGSFYVARLLPASWGALTPGHGAFIAALAVATVLGRRDRFALLMPIRPAARNAHARAVDYPGAGRRWGGWVGYLRGGVTGSVVMPAMWLIGIFGAGMMTMGGGIEQATDMLIDVAVKNPMALTMIWGFAAVMAFAPLRHLRALRAMPIPTRGLAWLLLGLPWVYGAVVSVEIWGIARLAGVDAPLGPLLTYGAGVIAVAVAMLPVLLTWGVSIRTIVILMVLSQVSIGITLTHIPLAVFLPATAVFALAGGVAAIRQLQTSSSPYRGSLVHISGWDRR